MKKTLFITLATLASFGAHAEDAPKWNEIELQAHTFQPQQAQFQTENYEFVIPKDQALEFSLNMDQDDTIVYHWVSDATGTDALLTEYHGHDTPAEGETGTLIFYKKHTNNQAAGSMTAPFSGNHGWYYKNTSDREISISLSVSGFFNGTKETPIGN